MALQESEYLHSTLYRFDEEARRSVVSSFTNAIGNTSAKCIYNVRTDTFCLTCPGEIGHRANEALRNAICNYVDNEFAAAEREERAPRIRRFVESIVDDDDISAALYGGETTLTQPTSSSNYGTGMHNDTPIALHSVNLEDASESACKPFTLHDLPNGFVDRTLAAPTAKFGRIIEGYFTYRVVIWSKRKLDYVFNGRLGLPNACNDSSTSKLFDEPTYVVISDERKFPNNTGECDVRNQVKHWSFVGKRPGIEQFLDGMGDIVLDEPGTQPDVPSDARKFLAQPDYQLSGTTRSRVPKGAVAVGSISDDEEEAEDAVNPATNSAKFSELLKDKKESEDASVAKAEGSSQSEDDPTFSKLISQARNPMPPPQTPPTVPTVNNSEKRLPTAPTARSSIHERSGSTEMQNLPTIPTTDRTYPQQNNSFPDYKDTFARIDRVGLTSKAGNQALWEHENPSPRNVNRSKRGIVRRGLAQSIQPLSPQPTTGSSAPMSLSTGPSLQQIQRPPSLNSIRSSQIGSSFTQNYTDTEHTLQPWSNTLHPVRTPMGRLVDTSAPAGSTTIRPPPGLPPPTNYEIQARQQAQRLPITIETNTGNSQVSQNLIEISDEEQSHARPKVNLPGRTNQILLQPSTTPPSVTKSNGVHAGHDEQVVERLQPASNKQFMKRFTMRQQAKKKGNKSKGQQPKPPAVTVNLPKPDPLPIPKQSRAVKDNLATPKSNISETTSNEATTLDSSRTSASTVRAYEKMRLSKPMTIGTNGQTNAPNDASGESTYTIGKLIDQLAGTMNLEDAALEVHFGVFLMTHLSNNDLLKGVYTSEMLQKKLNNAGSAVETQFLTRMTTSKDDAAFLLDLVDGDPSPMSVDYEIHIKNVEGNLRIIKFEQKDRHYFQVLPPETKLGTLHMHFPIRVWDAQAVVIERYADTSMIESVGEFLKSLQTIDEAPSFQAMVSLDSFVVVAVYVRRTFSKYTEAGMELRVSEVKDLELRSLNSSRYNLQATAHSEDVMIEQHRLWWECSLCLSPPDAVPADKVQQLVCTMVSQIDGVGAGNEGPWVKNENRRKKEDEEATEVPFW